MPIPLNIDLETFSTVDLLKSGVHKYVDSPDFEILLIGYSIDDQEERIIDVYSLKGKDESHPDVIEFNMVLDMVSDPAYLKKAWNAAFEMACLAKYTKIEISQWECTMIKASMLGYPMSLDKAGKVLDLEVQKSAAGKALIKFFSVPCKPTPARPTHTRNLPHHDIAKWLLFKNYCIFDVKVEKAIGNKISFFSISDREIMIWHLDQKINNKGVKIDMPFVSQAVNLYDKKLELLTAEAIELTGLNNPNSQKQLKEWLSAELEDNVTSLTKDSIKELIKDNKDPRINRLLNIRQEMAKTSVTKYKAMMACSMTDDRARGLLQFYGANKTGRWAGRLIQVQNLPHTKLPDLDMARNIVKSGDLDTLEIIFGNVSDVMSQLIRTAFIPKDDHLFLVADYSAIEARVVAWFANEEWRMEVFAGHGKIYEASGAQMFKIPIEQVVKDIRSKAKVAELALGYQGGVGAMERMGALKMGLKQEELQPIVNLWRSTNKKIVRLWADVENSAIEAISNPGMVVRMPKLNFKVKGGYLFIQLPSGRLLTYNKPYLKKNPYGKVAIGYEGVDQITKRWSKQDTYGGKLVENIVQATSRDILADAMVRLDRSGLGIVMHIHDEVVIEAPSYSIEVDRLNCDNIMKQKLSWAPDLPLNVESFVCNYYVKH
mgnify:CR=1 FL=1